MAADREKDTPSLEPPSLFGRKKRKPRTRAVEPDAVPDVPPEIESDSAPVAAPVAAPVEAPVAAPGPALDVPLDDAPPDDSPTTIFDDTTEPTAAPAAPPPTSALTPGLTPPPSPPPTEPHEPWLAARPAAAATGLLVGALIVAATAGSLRLCTQLTGTSSCGGPGFFLLIAILIVSVLVGTGLLRAAKVPDPGSTSFLAVGLLSVVALLFLVGSIFEWWMIIVIPLVSIATFLLSHWVTTTYIDPANDASDPGLKPAEHDVR